MAFEKCKQINELMAGFNKDWFFAGGWAIDLFLGKETRDHHDVEIGIYRKDQVELKRYLSTWDFRKVVHGEFLIWGDEFLELPVHEVHAKKAGGDLEVLLNETDGESWIFRRDRRITSPLESFIRFTEAGLPYLPPEIVLLYKAKNTRDKDHMDLMSVKEALESDQLRWLKQAISIHEPTHEWLQVLK
ncbi:nucleotidyltransferase domain-containing protein [Bacillus sp. CHD6a]|uniref:nucleotidyltransferase domain-containing protein n=1 Tax=Bacillus sp. CHD6a TaxID=1643452 RepID=UPI0006CD755C|nr:hypothetical protein [Bacillus sp. CHD6a]KPB05927.1 hypothetical protein AAV98_03070 [Bacillus sp. CHD6a]